MIESLGPLVSVFKLFLEGISKAAKTIKSSKNKAFQRKIIEIQLSLEDIIENAQYLLSLIERSSQSHKNENKELMEDFKDSLYSQLSRIYIIMDQITDNTSEKILKLFAPDLRRNIWDLANMKMGAINLVLRAMHDGMDKTKMSEEGLKSTIQSASLNWDHKRFVSEGESYLSQLDEHNKESQHLLSDHLKEQKEIIRCLSLCSNEFSQFIEKHIKIQDAIGLVNKKNF